MNCLPVNKKDDKHIEKNIEKEKNIHKTIEQKTPYNYFFHSHLRKQGQQNHPDRRSSAKSKERQKANPVYNICVVSITSAWGEISTHVKYSTHILPYAKHSSPPPTVTRRSILLDYFKFQR